MTSTCNSVDVDVLVMKFTRDGCEERKRQERKKERKERTMKKKEHEKESIEHSIGSRDRESERERKDWKRLYFFLLFSLIFLVKRGGKKEKRDKRKRRESNSHIFLCFQVIVTTESPKYRVNLAYTRSECILFFYFFSLSPFFRQF